ncbi:hypothetical protein ACEQ8H_008627 [Pleosporales sp. CAS-2024a]
MPVALQLPACQKCKLRKIRCDRAAPKCGNCTSHRVACLMVDPETGQQYARDYIHQLEQEERSLTETLNARDSTSANVISPATASTVISPATASTCLPRDQLSPAAGETESISHHRRRSQSCFVGDGSGLGYLQSILSDARWQQHRVRIMDQLAARPRLQRQQPTPNQLPPLAEAELLLENYFSRFHIHHTFLLRSEVSGIFSRLYLPASPGTSVSIQDRFRLFMVFAISATTMHRSGLGSQDPYGYFKAAERYLGDVPLIKNLDAIQNLLLVARFGMYHHIDTSLWDISQLCMRQCIEWGLHLQCEQLLHPLTEQHHRRVFWECYVLDRYSSGILGRPFGILDTDISVQLPIDADDETIINSGALPLDIIPPNTSSRPTELSVFIHCIKLRQISSRIHTKFYTGRPFIYQQNNLASTSTPLKFKSMGHAYTTFARFQSELKAWRAACPIFQDSRSLYEKPEWHDFLFEKDLMLLARGALHNVSSQSEAPMSITKQISLTCYQSASRVIELYDDLMRRGSITWTRSYFQVIFTAGLTIIYCIIQDALKDKMTELDPMKILAMCRNILVYFREKMPDAGSFTFVFELLEAECMRSKIGLHSTDHIEDSHVSSQITAPGVSCLSTQDTAAHGVSNIADSQLEPYSFQPFDLDTNDFGLHLTEKLDFMTQLETGLDEYAWGLIPTNVDLWNQM